jgi:hypothetical protein
MSALDLVRPVKSVRRRAAPALRTLEVLALVLALTAWGCSGLSLPTRSSGPKTFLQSDDYREGEEIVGELLTDSEYGRMVADLERRGIELDWGWAAATGGSPSKPAALSFALGSYRTITVEPVENASRQVAPGLTEAVHSALEEAFRLAGLEVSESGGELVLQAAVVDHKSDRTYAYVAMIDPFLEIELRLVERASGEPLLLVRHQEHGTTPALAAADFASDLALFLR